MADVTKNIHVKVQTFDPLQGQMIPVRNARVLVEHSSWLWDPDMSSGNDITNNDGDVEISITYSEDDENSLNPYLTVTIPETERTVPSGAAADRQFELPDDWETRHYIKRRIPNIVAHEDSNNPLVIFVGLHSRLRLSYTDFDSSGARNPMALPEDTVRVHLSDYDEFLWIDWLNPDDTLKGKGANPKQSRIISVGDQEEYPYFDVWPTAPHVLDGVASAPHAWTDPPGAPVSSIGGGSFANVGQVATDPNGMVFMIDGNSVRRFYPDGTLCETIDSWTVGVANHTFNAPAGLAIDQYRNLYVSDTGNNRIAIFRFDYQDGGTGLCTHVRSVGTLGAGLLNFNGPRGLCVVPNRVVDGEELLAVADPGNHRVQVFRITIPSGGSIRTNGAVRPNLAHLTQFGAPTGGSAANATTPVAAEMWEPVGVSSSRDRKLYTCDRSWHRVSRWAPDSASAPTSYAHEQDWEKAGGMSGAGNREFDTPEAVAVDSKNMYVYVAESGNNRVQRLDANTGGHLVNWLAPQLPTGVSPLSVATDLRGEVFVADSGNNRVIRGTVFDASGATIADATVPTNVGSPWEPVTETAHMLNPRYVTYGLEGRLWVSDSGNNRVLSYSRKASGELELHADRITADLDNPTGIAVAPDGVVFVADSGNHRVRSYSAAMAFQTDSGTGSAGSGDNEYDDPRGVAFVDRGGGLALYVADRNNDRVKVVQSDGTISHITTAGTTNLDKPEDVAFDSNGDLFVADTDNNRILRFNHENNFVRVISVTGHGQALAKPSGVSVDDEDRLIVTSRQQNMVYLVKVDPSETTSGDELIAYWDMLGLVRQRASTNVEYHPDLARLLKLDAPTRAVVDEHGMMAIADTGHSRIRLMRVFTNLNVNLFDLGEDLPDISFRAKPEADWKSDLGLKVDVDSFGNIDFSTSPDDDFSDDAFKKGYIFGSNHLNTGVNALKVIRQAQRWLIHLTRTDETEFQWGPASGTNRELEANFQRATGSFRPWDEDEFYLGIDASGRGPDAWDDSVVVHEMTHWITEKASRPRIPFARRGGQHFLNQIGNQNLAFNEGFADFTMLFWGNHFGSTDRMRGLPLVGGGSLVNLATYNAAGNATSRAYLFGGTTTSATPNWSTPGNGVSNESYVSNALWQIHHCLAGAELMFADAPNFWHFFNTELNVDQSGRFVNVIWKSLRLFPNDPTPQQFQAGCDQYFKQLQGQVNSEYPNYAQTVTSLLELNNMAMPVITITEGESDSAAGTALADTFNATVGTQKHVIIRATDVAGRTLRGYNLRINVSTGNVAHYKLRGGAGPTRRHGAPTPSAPPATDQYRATNADGIVNLIVEPLAGSEGNTETVNISYQPDFDNDETFEPPERADNRETTLRKLYLYELRAANKTWSGSGNNFGSIVTKTLTVNVQAS